MSNKNQVAFIEVSVGKLPEWYLEDEGNDAVVKAWNEDGDLVWERDNHDIGYAFDYAKRSW